jgi:ribosomal protein L44E
MSKVILVAKYQCEGCGMLSARSPEAKALMIRRDCPVCKESTTHHAVQVDQFQADIMASIEHQLKEQA